jgi:nucleoside 2-deoxyribosyltransferase
MNQLQMKELLTPERRTIYLAGPFFNQFQTGIIAHSEDICARAEIFCNSPRKFLVLKPKACWEERRQVFIHNLQKIQSSELMLACLDNLDEKGSWRPPDTGTLWEMGYAYAIGRPVVAFTASGQEKINVMLAQGCRGFLSDLNKVEDFLNGINGKTEEGHPFWDYAWDVAEEWRKEIF